MKMHPFCQTLTSWDYDLMITGCVDRLLTQHTHRRSCQLRLDNCWTWSLAAYLEPGPLLRGGVEAWLRRLLLLGMVLPGLALVRSGAKGEEMLPFPAGTLESPCPQHWLLGKSVFQTAGG